MVLKEKEPNKDIAGKKAHRKYLLKVKEDILKRNDTTVVTSTPADDTSTPASASYQTHIYGVGIVAVLAVGLIVYYKTSSTKKSAEIVVSVERKQPFKMME